MDQLEGERDQMDPNLVLLHTLATMSMSAIEDLDHDDPYEKVQWDEDLTERYLCIVPTQIHPIATGTGMYLRLSGYLCEVDPETESVDARRVTMSLPSRITKRMGADPENFPMKADPVDDAVVFMIITQYYGREEVQKSVLLAYCAAGIYDSSDARVGQEIKRALDDHEYKHDSAWMVNVLGVYAISKAFPKAQATKEAIDNLKRLASSKGGRLVLNCSGTECIVHCLSFPRGVSCNPQDYWADQYMFDRARSMSDIVAQDRSEARKTSRFLAILIIVTLFVPHSLEISRLNHLDNSYIRYSVFAVFWAIVHENGSTIAGPYSSTFFEFLSIPTLLFGVLFIPLYILVIITQSRFIKGTTTKRSILRVIGLALIIQAFLQSAFFSYQLDGHTLYQFHYQSFTH